MAGTSSTSSSKRRREPFRIAINLRTAFDEISAEAKKLRSDVMAAWKSNAALAKERDRLATDLRSATRRVERAEVVCTRALDWHNQADQAAAAVSQRNRTMSSYRTATNDLAEEKRLR
eukprot:399692-Pleurochrysis_carterae.AAC.1